MSDIAERIDAIVKADLAARLKAAGFRKSGRTFYRNVGEHTQVVNVQGNKWNEGGTGSFAVNLGVYLPSVAAAGGFASATGSFPKEYECTVQERLGRLAFGQDYWWEVDPATDVAAVAAAVGKAYDDAGRPWLDRVSNLEGAYGHACEQRLNFLAATIAFVQGRPDEAAQHLQRAIKATSSPQWKVRFQAWAERTGVALEPQ